MQVIELHDSKIKEQDRNLLMQRLSVAEKMFLIDLSEAEKIEAFKDEVRKEMGLLTGKESLKAVICWTIETRRTVGESISKNYSAKKSSSIKKKEARQDDFKSCKTFCFNVL